MENKQINEPRKDQLPKSIFVNVKKFHGFKQHTVPVMAHDNFRSFCFVQIGSFQVHNRRKQLLKCMNKGKYFD